MDKLKINDLLRYGFSGGIALFTLVVLYPNALSFFRGKDDYVETAFIGAFALIVGSLIYSLHRAVIYPLLYRLLIIALSLRGKYEFKCEMLVPWRPTKLDLTLDTKRWIRRKDKKSLQSELSEWGSQIHFLYTTSWAIILASFIGSLLPIPTKAPKFDQGTYLIISWVNWFIFISATITHWRHLIYENHLFYEKLIENEKQIAPSKGSEVVPSKGDEVTAKK